MTSLSPERIAEFRRYIAGEAPSPYPQDYLFNMACDLLASLDALSWRDISETPAFGEEYLFAKWDGTNLCGPVVEWWTEEGDDWPHDWEPTHYKKIHPLPPTVKEPKT